MGREYFGNLGNGGLDVRIAVAVFRALRAVLGILARVSLVGGLRFTGCWVGTPPTLRFRRSAVRSTRRAGVGAAGNVTHKLPSCPAA